MHTGAHFGDPGTHFGDPWAHFWDPGAHFLDPGAHSGDPGAHSGDYFLDHGPQFPASRMHFTDPMAQLNQDESNCRNKKISQCLLFRSNVPTFQEQKNDEK